MTDIGRRPDAVRAERARYIEPARSYVSSAVLGGLIVAGFLLDLLLGGGGAHLIGWAIALVVVAGIDALTVHAARVLRTVTVTESEVRVGDDAIARADVIGIERCAADPPGPILGRTAAEGLPRGCAGLSLRLADGRRVTVPTRRPDRLAAALHLELTLPEIRLAEPGEGLALAEIDRRAETLFHVAGMQLPRVVFAVDALRDSKAVFVHGRPPVGFVRIEEFDGLAHIEDLAVLPSHMRRGIGSALLETACSWAANHGYRAVTLITYADVPWNAPFYAARGFVEVDEPTPELAEARDWERTVGLDALGRRVVMRRNL
jgi:GNAT superfamily N-acetyltransferase